MEKAPVFTGASDLVVAVERIIGEGKHFPGLVIHHNGGAAHPGQIRMLAGRGLFQRPEGIHVIIDHSTLLRNIFLRNGGGVVGNGVGHFPAQEGLFRILDDGDGNAVDVIAFCFDIQIHGFVFLDPFLGGVAGGEGSGVIVIEQVSRNTTAAENEQGKQQRELSFGELQTGFRVVSQLQLVGDGLHDRQEQRQHHRFDGEHEEVLDDLGYGQHIAGAAHHQFIVEHHDGSLQKDIHKQTDAEPAQGHPGGGHLCPVEEEGKDHTARDFRQGEGRKIHITADQHTDHIGDQCGGGGHHRAKYHGAKGVGKEGGVDFQIRGKGNGNQLQGHPDGDHQGCEHQHFGVFQFCGGIPPVGTGEGGLVKGCGFGNSRHNFSSCSDRGENYCPRRQG